MAGKSTIDRDALYDFLWRNADPHGRFHMTAAELADFLQMPIRTVYWNLNKLREEDRVRKFYHDWYVVRPGAQQPNRDHLGDLK